MPLVGSIILKIIIYSLWCYIAIRYLPQKHHKIHYSNKFKSALKFGVIRIIIGLIIGMPIWFLTTLIFAGDYSNHLSTALLILVCSHLISWCIILRIMLGRVLVKLKVIFWIAGGTSISCLMDMILQASFLWTIGFC